MDSTQCYRPLRAYQNSGGSVFFSELRRHGDIVRVLELRCGQCVGCRLERSRSWAARCMHEAQLHERNCFLTLTYAETGPSLVYKDFQDFMKRFRKRCGPVRFYMCGEYTEGDPVKGYPGGRPHFHACIFGYDFPDKEWHSRSPSGSTLYRSPLLETLWTCGFSTVGDVTFQSAAYVARYCMKKLTGDGDDKYYNIFDPSTGEIWVRAKEFCHMSLKPGIGAGWIDRFRSDVYPSGLMVVNGAECRPPKYYDRRYKKFNELAFEELAYNRELAARAKFSDNTDERLLVKEQVAKARLILLKRSLS